MFDITSQNIDWIGNDFPRTKGWETIPNRGTVFLKYQIN